MAPELHTQDRISMLTLAPSYCIPRRMAQGVQVMVCPVCRQEGAWRRAIAGQVNLRERHERRELDEIDRAIHEAAVKVQNIGTSMDAWKHQLEARKVSQ